MGVVIRHGGVSSEMSKLAVNAAFSGCLRIVNRRANG